jgi:hypothetical protein
MVHLHFFPNCPGPKLMRTHGEWPDFESKFGLAEKGAGCGPRLRMTPDRYAIKGRGPDARDKHTTHVEPDPYQVAGQWRHQPINKREPLSPAERPIAERPWR